MDVTKIITEDFAPNTPMLYLLVLCLEDVGMPLTAVSHSNIK